MSGRNILAILGRGMGISRNWESHVFTFVVCLGSVMASVGMSFSLLTCYSEHLMRLKFHWKLNLLPSWTLLVLNSFFHVLAQCHSFKCCALPPSLLFQEQQQSGKMVDLASPKKTVSEDSVQSWKLLVSDNHWHRDSESLSPAVSRLVISSRSYLVHSLITQFVQEITEGEAKGETWSSVNYLFFISISLIQGKNQQVRPGIEWSKDLKDVLGLERSRAWECLL